MPYIIILVLVIAIIVVAIRKQKFEQSKAQNVQSSIRNEEKENSIEVNDYTEIND